MMSIQKTKLNNIKEILKALGNGLMVCEQDINSDDFSVIFINDENNVSYYTKNKDNEIVKSHHNVSALHCLISNSLGGYMDDNYDIYSININTIEELNNHFKHNERTNEISR